MKMSWKQLVAVFLVATMYFSILPSTDAYAKTTKEQLEEAEQEHQETTGKLKETQDNIDSLNDTKDSLQGQLNQLTDQLTEVSDNLDELEGKIEKKQAEIDQAILDLEEAERIESEQYEAMKKRIRFMYEKKEHTYTEMLFTSTSFADFLNKNDYIQKLSEYDRKMLDKFQATREAVAQAKQNLENEMEQLEKMKAEVEEEQAKVSGYVDATKGSIGKYEGQIAAAEAQADAYEEKAKEEEKNIAALKKKLAEEIAMSKLAAKSAWRDISEVSFAEDDRYLLANLIYCEAGNQPYAGQLAVGAVVINRVLSSVYPNTVVGVIYQNKQFSPVGDGHLALALANDKATEACYKAADEAMAGHTNVGTCVYFRTPIEGLSGIQIGGHIFY